MMLPIPPVFLKNLVVETINTATYVGVGGIALGVLAWIWHHWRLALLPLFTRLLRPKLLEQPVRAAIHDLVDAEPGIHHASIAQRLHLAEGQALYHLGVLVRERLLSRVDTPARRHFFVHGRYPPTLMRAMAELRLPASRRLFDAVRRSAGLSVRAISDELAVSASRVSRTSRRLEEVGLVRREARGREVRLFANAPAELVGFPTFREFGQPPVPTRAVVIPIARSRRA